MTCKKGVELLAANTLCSHSKVHNLQFYQPAKERYIKAQTVLFIVYCTVKLLSIDLASMLLYDYSGVSIQYIARF